MGELPLLLLGLPPIDDGAASSLPLPAAFGPPPLPANGFESSELQPGQRQEIAVAQVIKRRRRIDGRVMLAELTRTNGLPGNSEFSRWTAGCPVEVVKGKFHLPVGVILLPKNLESAMADQRLLAEGKLVDGVLRRDVRIEMSFVDWCQGAGVSSPRLYSFRLYSLPIPVRPWNR